MSFRYAAAAATPRQDGKTEDRVAAHQVQDALVIVVADGAGGIPGGDVAADAVVHGIADAIANEPETFQRVEGLVALLRRLDDDIERMPMAGETTAVVAVITEHGVFGASCGDSGAWLVEEVGFDDLTADQRRTLRLGSGRTKPAPFVRAGVDGTLVVASDGLFNFARPEAICSNARGLSLSAAACGLVAAVRTERGDLMDDVAVAVVRRVGAV
jgi:serine/threonine protein phosphatase PrpC